MRTERRRSVHTDRIAPVYGIHHIDYRVVIPQDPDDHRHLPEPEMLRGIFPAVSGNNLIHTFLPARFVVSVRRKQPQIAKEK